MEKIYSYLFILFSVFLILFESRANPSNDTIVLLGENHQKNNTENKTKLIKEYLKDRDSLTLFLEIPISYTKVVNEFVNSKEGCSIRKELRNISFQNKRDFKKLLHELKEICENSNKNIEIICFDLELTFKTFPYEGLEMIFKYYPEIKKTELHGYVVKNNLEDLPLIMEMLKTDTKYKDVLKQDYNLVLSTLISIDVSLNSGKRNISNVDLLEKREQFLAHIIKNFGRNPFKLVFVGQDHLSKIIDDEWYEYPTLRVLLEDNNTTLISIYTIYENDINRLFSFFSAYGDYLCESDFNKLKERKHMFSHTDLDCSPELKKRCDYLIMR